MELRPTTDRAASGDGTTASPQLSVFSDSAPPGVNAGPATDRPEPANHDIYRRPANAIPFRRPPATPPGYLGAEPLPAASTSPGADDPTGGPGAGSADGSPFAAPIFAERSFTGSPFRSTDHLDQDPARPNHTDAGYDQADNAFDAPGAGYDAAGTSHDAAGSGHDQADQVRTDYDQVRTEYEQTGTAGYEQTGAGHDQTYPVDTDYHQTGSADDGDAGTGHLSAGGDADGGSDAPRADAMPASATPIRPVDDLANTGEYPVIASDDWHSDHADDTHVAAGQAEYYPPFALVDDLFFDDKGPDLPTQVNRVTADDPAAADDATALQPALVGAVPAGGRKGRRILGMPRGSLVAALLVVALAVTGVVIAVYAAGADPLRSAARNSAAGTGAAAGGPAAGAPAKGGPAAPAPDTAPGEPNGQAAPADQGATGGNTDPAAAHSASAPRNGRDEASFDLLNGTTTVKLRADDLGDDLFRVATPVGSDVLPRPVEQGDRVQLHLVRSGEDGPGSVEITLNSQVRWALRITGGAAEHVIDMSDGHLTGLEILGGATRVELNLPEPDGTVEVKMTGGVNEFAVGTPPDTPVRLRIGSGAAQVVLDGKTHRGIAPGRVFVPTRWGHADNRIELNAVAGVGTLTLNRQ